MRMCVETSPALAGWPHDKVVVRLAFLHKILGIWSFSLVGLKNLIWPLVFFWHCLTLVGLLFFGLIYATKVSSAGNTYYSVVFDNTSIKFCDKCYIRPRPTVWC